MILVMAAEVALVRVTGKINITTSSFNIYILQYVIENMIVTYDCINFLWEAEAAMDGEESVKGVVALRDSTELHHRLPPDHLLAASTRP